MSASLVKAGVVQRQPDRDEDQQPGVGDAERGEHRRERYDGPAEGCRQGILQREP